MWCLDCDYELINLADNRCPECGRAFDANDPATFRTEAAVAETRSFGITTSSAIAGAVVGVVSSSLFVGGHAFLRAVVGAVAGTIGGILAAVIVGLIWRERKSGSSS